MLPVRSLSQRATCKAIERLLRAGIGVIMDATNLRERHREPVYEIAEATDLLLAVRAADAEVGAARANAAHVVPAWWEGADAHTWILWAVLLLAVVVLGFLTLRLAGAADADAPAASSDTPADAEPEAADEEAGDEEGGDEPPPSAPGGGGDGPASF